MTGQIGKRIVDSILNLFGDHDFDRLSKSLERKHYATGFSNSELHVARKDREVGRFYSTIFSGRVYEPYKHDPEVEAIAREYGFRILGRERTESPQLEYAIAFVGFVAIFAILSVLNISI